MCVKQMLGAYFIYPGLLLLVYSSENISYLLWVTSFLWSTLQTLYLYSEMNKWTYLENMDQFK